MIDQLLHTYTKFLFTDFRTKVPHCNILLLTLYTLFFVQVTMPRLSIKDGMNEKRQLEWEAAMEAALRDIAAPLSKQKKPPVVQIVIYESSV